MRPPSRIVLSLITTGLLALAGAGSAAAEEAASSASFDAAQLDRLVATSVDLGETYAAVRERIDERLEMALSGPTTMECSKSDRGGLETCVVRAQGSASVPASLAQN